MSWQIFFQGRVVSMGFRSIYVLQNPNSLCATETGYLYIHIYILLTVAYICFLYYKYVPVIVSFVSSVARVSCIICKLYFSIVIVFNYNLCICKLLL